MSGTTPASSSSRRQPARRGRAANGRSTIYRDATGGWHGQVSMGRSEDGTPVRRHVRGRTRTEVTAKVERLEDERARSAGRPSSSQRLRVGQWLDEWLVIIQRTRKPKTYDTYASLLRVHTGPLRRTPLTRLVVRDVDDLLHRVAERSPQSAVSLHRVLRSSLNTAVKRGLIRANPCTHAVVPRVQEGVGDGAAVGQAGRAAGGEGRTGRAAAGAGRAGASPGRARGGRRGRAERAGRGRGRGGASRRGGAAADD